MTKLWVMRGLSGSGKSSRAREIANENDAVVICRDDLRMQLLGAHWTGNKVDEERVSIAEKASVLALLKAGVSVVVDATHLHAPYARAWAKEATRLAVEFELVDVIEDVAVCRQRDHQRMLDGGRYVGDKVIEQQAKRAKYPMITATPFIIEPVTWIDDLPECVLVDIDGTVANHKGIRSPFDYSKVLSDTVHENIAWLVRELYYRPQRNGDAPVDIIFMSGRDDTCRVDTERWLDMHDIPYDRLIMRPADARDAAGNKLPDYQVKYHLFNEHIRGKYNVRVVIDDRRQVCDMWHALGLSLARVGDPDADF